MVVTVRGAEGFVSNGATERISPKGNVGAADSIPPVFCRMAVKPCIFEISFFGMAGPYTPPNGHSAESRNEIYTKGAAFLCPRVQKPTTA